MIVWSEILSAFPDIDDKQTVEDKLNKVGESPMDFVNKNQHHHALICEYVGITGWEVVLKDKIEKVSVCA